MSLFTKGMHHLHVRKRVHQNLEPFPHPNKYKAFLDKIIYVVGISGPIMTLPQVFKIYLEKSAGGVSLISWSWYLFTAIIWLFYAIVHKEKPLIISNIFWILIEIVIVIEIIIYS